MKKFIIFIAFLLSAISVYAQIGYQVSLLNTATGEPRANEKVTAKIELSNSDGEVVYSETQTGVTNDFGVLSLTIGNAQSLSAIDWSKYPMFISVTVDNVLIGKTQVMSVPYANAVVPINQDVLVGTWKGTKKRYHQGKEYDYYTYTFQFNADGTCYLKKDTYNGNSAATGIYRIYGNQVHCFLERMDDEYIQFQNSMNNFILDYYEGSLIVVSGDGDSHMRLNK